MKLHNVVQGITEWSELRAGIPTASQFHRILTKSGKKSEQREAYMMDLLAERLLGRPLDPYISLPMQHGSLTEAEAVAWYHLIRDVQTERVGFVTNDAETWGASPDRFVGDIGLLEIKCPDPGTHMGYLMKAGSAYDKYRVQCSGQLWICERHWSDVMSYYPDMPEALTRIERDEKYITILAEAVQEFSAELELKWAWCCDQNWVVKPSRKPISQQDELIKAMKESLIELKR